MKSIRFNLCTIASAMMIGMAATAWADVPFNGLILDSTLSPVNKVKVYTTNERRYARTDKKGRFGLTDVAPDDTLTLVVSKKKIIRIPVEGRTGIKIILQDENGGVKASQDDDCLLYTSDAADD